MDNYARILLSSLVLSITQAILFPFLPIYAYEIGGRFAHAGYVYSLPSLILVVMTFGWGSLSDRLGNRRSIIIVSNVVASFMYFLFTHVNITGLIVLRCIQTFFYSSYILIPAIVTESYPSSKGRALGRYNVATGAGWTIGAVFSGHAATIGFEFLFALTGLLSLLFCILFYFSEDIPREKETKRFREFLVFGEPKKIFLLCLYAFVLMTGGTILSSIFNVYLRNLQISMVSIGYITSLTSLTFLLVADTAGKACDSIGRKPLLLVTPLLYMGMWLGIGLTENMVTKILLWILPFYALFLTASTSAVSDLTSGKERGRGVGILNSSIGLGTFAGGVIGGNLADFFGPRNTFLSASLFAVIGFLISLKMTETKDYVTD